MKRGIEREQKRKAIGHIPSCAGTIKNGLHVRSGMSNL